MYSLIPAAAALLSAASFAFADPTVPEIVPRQAVTQTLAFTQPSQSCVGGAHVIVARASLENPGEGVLQQVASSIQSMVPNSDAVAVVYPATESQYPTSEQEGVVGMKQLVTAYVDQCPGHWIILLGYSQGAQVVGDTLIGSNNSGFSDRSTNPIGLGKNYLAQIAAVIQMGDPGFTTDTPGHVGNASKNGLFPRLNAAAYTQYGFNNKMQTYCDAGDLVCAGGASLAVHVGYVQEYGAAAASYAASKFSSVNGGGSGTVATSAAGGGSTSAAAQTTAAKTSAATSAAAAGGSTTKAASSSTITGLPSSLAFLTSNRYVPTTTAFTGVFSQLANPVKTGAAAPVANAQNGGVAAAVFGAAMFVMGLF